MLNNKIQAYTPSTDRIIKPHLNKPMQPISKLYGQTLTIQF